MYEGFSGDLEVTSEFRAGVQHARRDGTVVECHKGVVHLVNGCLQVAHLVPQRSDGGFFALAVCALCKTDLGAAALGSAAEVSFVCFL